MTNEEIISALGELPEGLSTDICRAWYSERAIINALGFESDAPMVMVVRVRTKSGMLELHPKDGEVHIKCYCCFGGDPDKGLFPLERLRDAVITLKDHHCPPWPG